MPQSSSAIHTINRIRAYDKLLDIVIFSNTAFSLHQLRLGRIYMKMKDERFAFSKNYSDV